MVTLVEAARLAGAMPDVTEGTRFGRRTWFVGGRKAFAWERPYSKADLRRFGNDVPPDGPILAVSVADLGEKEAVLAAYPAAFTIAHFDNFPAVLVQLSKTTKSALRELIEDAWLACAPAELAEQYLSAKPPKTAKTPETARPAKAAETKSRDAPPLT